MDHPLYQQACQLIDQSGLGPVAERLKLFLKPAIRMESSPASAHPLPVGASKLGGLPDLPPTLTWPTWKEVPMVFLVQINLQEVAPYDLEQLLPAHGFLYFFCQSQSLSQGFDTKVWDYIDPYEPESWRVLFFDGKTADLHATPVPEGLAQEALLPGCTLQFGPALTLPPVESAMITSLHLGKEERKQYRNLLQIFDDVFLGTDDTVYHHHRLLGYPFQMQGDMQLLCQMANLHVALEQWTHLDEETKASIEAGALEWVHLLQIDTDEYAQVTWGDNGSLSYWIKQADLKRQDFKECCAITDSL